MTTPPDRRRSPWRNDLAAETLRGIVDAPRYATGATAQVIWPVAGLRQAPRPDAGLDTEVLLGARIVVYERSEGWAWVQVERDSYVGYLPEAAISERIAAPTHRVAALATHVYPAADIKLPPLLRLPLGAEVAITDMAGAFARTAAGGYVFAGHLAALSSPAPDYVAVAEQLLGTPYLWGGRTPLGCDCSGLVQLAMQAAGMPAPRDSDMQAAEIGRALAIGDDLAGLARGDLVCWRGHIGIMRDGSTLLHANAHHMQVASEPLAAATQRIAAAGGRPTGFRRPAPPAA